MQLLLLISVAVGVAAGLALQDGGATLSTSPLEGLRARQYVLLSTSGGGIVPPVGLSPTSSVRGESVVGLLGGFSNSVARAASLDTAGFESVAATQSTAAMATFVHRFLKSQNLRVKDETFMLSVLPYYTGECANLSFSVLAQQLLAATHARSCYPAWVVRQYSKGRYVDKRYMKPRIVQDIDRAAVLLVSGVMAELGAIAKPGNVEKFKEFATKFVANNRSIMHLRQQLTHKRFKAWIEFGKPAHEPTFVDKGPFSSWFPHLGTAAPLNGDGYRAIVYTRSDEEMSSFIRRVAEKEGLMIVKQEAIAGMTPFYSGLCGKQSYEALVRELHELAGQKFTMRFDLKASSKDSLSLVDLQAMIAQRAGVDVGQVTIEDIGANKSSSVRLNRHRKRHTNHHRKRHMNRNRKMQKHRPVQSKSVKQHPAQEKNSPGMVAAHAGPSSFVADAAHGSAESKELRVTTSVDGAPQLRDIKTWLQAPSILPGRARFAPPESIEVEASTPAQCGGGLLLPK